MLPRNRRLTRALFDAIKVSRAVVNNQTASFRFAPSPAPGRFSVVVSKTLTKSAVRRNNLRRLVYEALRVREVDLDGIFYMRKVVPDVGAATKAVDELLKLAEGRLPRTSLK